jgi:Ca2+/Na+ antiporter
MFALGRLLVVGFLVLSVVYICLSLYSRAVRRDKLEKEWDEEIQQGDRETFVEAGLREYDGSLRRKLSLGVYIVPLTVISVIIYLTNFH